MPSHIESIQIALNFKLQITLFQTTHHIISHSIQRQIKNNFDLQLASITLHIIVIFR